MKQREKWFVQIFDCIDRHTTDNTIFYSEKTGFLC